MLKNKKFTYVLLVLVLIIWGVIFYKVYSNFGGKKQFEKILPQVIITDEKGQNDSIFTLVLDYPDPFLKGIGLPDHTSLNSLSKSSTIKQNPVWPQIEYRGLLSISNKKESTGLLKVQNLDCLVKSGKVYSGVKIRSITKDSIFLEYLKQSRWLRCIK